MMILGTALTGLFSVWHKFWFRWQRRWLHRTNAASGRHHYERSAVGDLAGTNRCGLLANLGGWRTVFWVASVLMH